MIRVAARSTALKRSGVAFAAVHRDGPAVLLPVLLLIGSTDVLDPSAGTSGAIADETLPSLPVTGRSGGQCWPLWMPWRDE